MEGDELLSTISCTRYFLPLSCRLPLPLFPAAGCFVNEPRGLFTTHNIFHARNDASQQALCGPFLLAGSMPAAL